MAFEFIDHTADIGVRITARSPAELVAEAARAFYHILLEEEAVPRIEAREEREVDVEGRDGEEVLVAFLNELIYRFDAEGLLLPEVRLQEATLGRAVGRIRGKLLGERYEPPRHLLRTQVKGATHHGLKIEESDGMLKAEVIFDL